MIVTAAQRMGLDLARSWIVGDQVHDLAAGRAAGVAGGTLLTAGSLDSQQASALAGAQFDVEVASNLADAVTKLLEQGQLGTRS
jgi:D-glycero-D-manno-heptose 1,7-bisphosphate phosphatase